MAILKRDQVRLEDAPLEGARRTGAACGSRGSARGVRLLRAGGVVRAIELTCACGEVSVLELEYAPLKPAPAGEPAQANKET